MQKEKKNYKAFLKGIKISLNELEKSTIFLNRKTQHHKNAISSKISYKFNATAIKIFSNFPPELDNLIIKFI